MGTYDRGAIAGKIIECIPLRFDGDSILERAGRGREVARRVLAENLAQHAEALGRSNALYLLGAVRKETDRSVVIGAVTLTSRVLGVNLDRVDRAFPFVATCGWELDRWATGRDEPLERRLAEFISEAASYQVLGAPKERLRGGCDLTVILRMSPGSLHD
jgi:hypothetical protein